VLVRDFRTKFEQNWTSIRWKLPHKPSGSTHRCEWAPWLVPINFWCQLEADRRGDSGYFQRYRKIWGTLAWEWATTLFSHPRRQSGRFAPGPLSRWPRACLLCIGEEATLTACSTPNVNTLRKSVNLEKDGFSQLQLMKVDILILRQHSFHSFFNLPLVTCWCKSIHFQRKFSKCNRSCHGRKVEQKEDWVHQRSARPNASSVRGRVYSRREVIHAQTWYSSHGHGPAYLCCELPELRTLFLGISTIEAYRVIRTTLLRPKWPAREVPTHRRHSTRQQWPSS
jgi:hypothetical protein